MTNHVWTDGEDAYVEALGEQDAENTQLSESQWQKYILALREELAQRDSELGGLEVLLTRSRAEHFGDHEILKQVSAENQRLMVENKRLRTERDAAVRELAAGREFAREVGAAQRDESGFDTFTKRVEAAYGNYQRETLEEIEREKQP